MSAVLEHNPVHAHGLRFAALGIPVFPAHRTRKQPSIEGWQDLASSDPETIAGWFGSDGTHPRARLGVKTGVERRDPTTGAAQWLTAIDLDVKPAEDATPAEDGKPAKPAKPAKDGPKALAAACLAAKFDLSTIKTLVVRTASGGTHLYFWCNVRLKNKADVLIEGNGVDIRSDGGLVIGPGSAGKTGDYRIVIDEPIATMPDALAALFPLDQTDGRPADTTPIPGIDPADARGLATAYLKNEAPLAVENEGGDGTAYRVACRVKDFGCTEAEALDVMLEHWDPRCEPPWEDELATKVANAYRHGKEPPGIGNVKAVFTPVAKRVDDPPPPPAYSHKPKSGEVQATVGNVHMALSRPDQCGLRLGFDEFLGKIMVGEPGGYTWRPLADNDYWNIRRQLEGRRGFLPVSKEMTRDGVNAVAGENAFDSAIEWARSLKWDGVERVAAFAQTYLKVDGTPYATAWSRYLWTALAGRTLVPGCKVDMVPLISSEEGFYKSSAVKALAPFDEAFAELDVKAQEDDISRLMRGRIVLEWSELRGLTGRDEESIKGFITQTTQRWVPKYQENAQSYKRRCVIVGTTNDLGVLPAYGKARRWLPLHLSQHIDADGIRRDRDQLWAEAVVLFDKTGVDHGPVAALADDERAGFREVDPASHAAREWLSTPTLTTAKEGPKTRGDAPFELSELMQSLTARGVRHDQRRLGQLLGSMGYINCQPFGRNDRRRGWRKQDDQAA